MAIITIGIADLSKALPDNVIRFYCKKCDDSTLHNRLVKDEWTKKFRKPLRLSSPRCGFKGNKSNWRCQECGEIALF